MMSPVLSAVSNGSELAALIREVIAEAGGVVPFARFMELALYAPELGYYERSPRPVGHQGDFYTSVSVGPVFGELLGFQFAQWLADSDFVQPEAPVDLVETGAHDGRLAGDILGWLETGRPALLPRIRMWLVEPSPRRRQWQWETLRRFGPTVQWVSGLDELEERTGGVRGVFYSNELLDAFPVHRIAWNSTARAWEEQGVAVAGDRFSWRKLPTEAVTAAQADRVRLSALPAELLSVLPDGFTVEACPAAAAWWREAAGVLRQGALVTLDYGFADDAVLRPELPAGTLRAYRNHRGFSDVLSDPGEQDLTAQVDFESVAAAGEAAGMMPLVRASQRGWLTRIFGETLAAGSGFPAWDAARIRQFQTLTHPEHLGRRFQVLVQTRIPGAALSNGELG
jgi:SAM-dependent MidA family methyltransferase